MRTALSLVGLVLAVFVKPDAACAQSPEQAERPSNGERREEPSDRELPPNAPDRESSGSRLLDIHETITASSEVASIHSPDRILHEAHGYELVAEHRFQYAMSLAPNYTSMKVAGPSTFYYVRADLADLTPVGLARIVSNTNYGPRLANEGLAVARGERYVIVYFCNSRLTYKLFAVPESESTQTVEAPCS